MIKTKRIILPIAAAVIALVFYYSFGSGAENYTQQIEQERADKDDFFRSHPESPLPDSLKTIFQGLTYFETNESYKVKARLQPIESNEVISMPTSDGKQESYSKYAYATFNLQGQGHQLLLLKPVPEKKGDQLFLAFRDATSGAETYGGGRYLDLKPTSSNNLIIDFNLAYNPFCAFSENYSCPLPPAENLLSIGIPAGEKNFNLP